jgi:formiminotetrahydrofolate cyclodeaminase
MASALAAMVARLTIGRKKYKAVQDQMQALASQADALRAALMARAAEDAQAYAGVMTAYRRPKETSEERASRAAAIQVALSRAATAPLAIARVLLAMLRLVDTAARSGVRVKSNDNVTGQAIVLSRDNVTGTAVVLTDWLSTMAALGSAARASSSRTAARKAAFRSAQSSLVRQ